MTDDGQPSASELPVKARLEEKRRELQLETINDLLVSLHSHASEQDLASDLLERVCAVVDPSAAVVVTRDAYGTGRVVTSVGWTEDSPEPEKLLDDPLWRELVAEGTWVRRQDGELAGRGYREILATPLVYRGVFLGYVAIADKEGRDDSERTFTTDDRRFLTSVAALAGVTLDGLRRMESLVTRSQQLAEENKALRDRLWDDVGGHRIIAQAAPMREVLEIVERVAPRRVSVLVRGESGTGKELVAKLLHACAGRSGPLVAVNCAALPESLLESELFGIEGGVATGVEARIGKFELADGGTLFLDEIGDLQPALQVKLLRVLQEREIVRVGGRHPITVDVRLVAATHRSLNELIDEGSFREDLYYRLRGVEVELPPLRDRRSDIPLLVRYFLERFCEIEGLEPPVVDQDALTLLLAHDYPGNVRELQNLIEGAVSLSDGVIGPELLRSLLGSSDTEGPQALDLASVERRHIRKVLRMTGGNKSAAARLLGIDRRTLGRKGY